MKIYNEKKKKAGSHWFSLPPSLSLSLFSTLLHFSFSLRTLSHAKSPWIYREDETEEARDGLLDEFKVASAWDSVALIKMVIFSWSL